MSNDDRLVCVMDPGWHTVDELSAKLSRDYATVLFTLERLEGFGFATNDGQDSYALTPLGERLRRILLSY